jgi:methionyl-tRNA formyltransferase
MRIALLCATRRGYRFLEKLIQIAPQAELVVFSFHEDAWEPPFRDDIRALTEAHGGQFYETKAVAAERWREFWDTTPLDLMIAVSWRYLIPREVYSRPHRGTFIFHDSLLPAYRGFGPTVWSIINGEDHTGVTLFEIADDVDSGDIVAQQRVPIGSDDTIADVMEQVTRAYLDLLEANLIALLDGTAPRTPQDHTLATYTCKRLPKDNQLDWTQPTQTIYNLIRAVTHPYTGALTTLDGQPLRVWAAQTIVDYKPYIGRIPGRVVEIRRGQGAVVLTGDGALLITQVQLADNPPVRADEVLNKLALTLGR